MIGAIIFLVAMGLLITWLVVEAVIELHLFTWDKTNPYRRRCKKCGATQTVFEWAWGGSSWWEEMYPGDNPECKCHKYATNK